MERTKIEAVGRERLSETRAGHGLFVPAEVYGKGITNRHLAVSVEQVEKALIAGGQATLLDLQFGDEALPVIIKAIQRDHLKGFLLHVDFYQINENVKVVVEATLKPFGKSNAIATLGGTLVSNLHKIKIECLPKDLVSTIEVDISKLEHLRDVIRVEDLDLPTGVTFKNSARDAVYSVMASRKAKAAAAGAVEAPAGKVTAGDKKAAAPAESADEKKAPAKKK